VRIMGNPITATLRFRIIARDDFTYQDQVVLGFHETEFPYGSKYSDFTLQKMKLVKKNLQRDYRRIPSCSLGRSGYVHE